MEFLAILAVILVVFLVFVVPWAALSGRGEALAARRAVEALRDQVNQLSRELDATRMELTAAVLRATEAAVAATPEPAVSKARKTRAAAKTADADAVVQRASDPGPPASGSLPGIGVAAGPPDIPASAMPTPSPWLMPSAMDFALRAERERVEAGRDDAGPQGPGGQEPPPVPPQAAPAPAPAPKKDFEEVLGTRWAVWVGGLALAIGALFLVRYSIEAGFFGPRVRLAMAGILSALLFAAGEALRRGALMPRRIRESMGDMPVAHAPLALTAAGVVAAFGTIYAAYAIYGFLGQATAFVLMAGVGLGAIALSLLHGQAIAGVGMLASYATPVLVGGESGSRWTIVVYLLVVTAAAMAIQNRLRSAWLGAGAFVGMGLWTFLLVALAGRAGVPELTMITGSLALFAVALVWLRRPHDQPASAGDPLVLACLAGPLAAVGLVFLQPSASMAATVVFAVIALVIVAASALRDGRAALAIVAAALLPLGMTLVWPSFGGDRMWLVRLLDGAMLAFVKLPAEPGWLAAMAIVSGLVLLAAPLAVLFRRMPLASPHDAAGLHAIAFIGGLAPVVLAFAWAVRSGVQTRDLAVAALFAGLTIALGLISDRLYARRSADRTPGPDDAPNVEEIGAGGYAAGAALAMGLAIAFALPGLWMAVGFAAAALAVSVLNDRRPLPALRRVAAVMASTAVLRGVTSPALFGAESWPLLNWYIVAYGVPAAALAAGAWFLARQGRDRNVRVLEGAALLSSAAFAAFELRHAVHRNALVEPALRDIALRPPGFHETWMIAAAALAFLAIGLWMRRRDDDGPAACAWIGGLAVMLAAVGLGYGILHNPIAPFRFFVEGYPLFNRLTLGYGLSVVFLAAAAWMLWREGLPSAARWPALLAAAFAAFWLFTQVRMAFHGGDLVSEGEVGLGEAGVYTLLFAGAAAGVHAAILRFGPRVPAALYVGANAAAFASAAVLCLLVSNPWFDADLYGPPLLDSSFVGYLLTGLMFGLLAWRLRTRPTAIDGRFIAANRTAAIALVYVYLITQVRRAFAGAEGFVSSPIRDAEQYAYSAATLAFGVALLAVGFRLASRDVRLASAVFVTLAVAKVFLFDMAGLTGLWRAFSFIGLGAVLIGIGLVYQRLLFERRTPAPTAGGPPPAPPS